MEVIVVRHGVAMDRQEALAEGMADEDRPLTSKGQRRMKEAAKGLVAIAPEVVLVLSSPLRRAVETADIVRRAYDDVEYAETPALRPEAEPQELAQFLAESASAPTALVVGHEPHLSRWVSWCMTGEGRPVLSLRKGGACLLSFEDAPSAAKGRLAWLAPPSVLRRIE